MNNLEQLKQFLIKNNGKGDYTWPELALRFNLQANVDASNYENEKKYLTALGKKANDIWRRLKRQKKENKNPRPSLTLKSEWQQQGKGGEIITLRSWKNGVTDEHIIQFREDLIEDLKKFTPKEFKARPAKKSSKGTPKVVEISIPDFHIGREQNIDSYDVLFMDYLKEIVEKTKHYDIFEYLFVCGNDWLNTDNHLYTTTRGTQQFDYQPWYATFQKGWKLLAKGILYLSQYANVKVLVVPGNHDLTRMTYIGEVLEAYFHTNPYVSVDNRFVPFKFYSFGNNLIMFEHGELKTMEYPMIMATNRPIEWAKAKYKEVHLGHLHAETVKEYNGVKVRHLPSLAKNSDWENSKGYVHLKQAQTFVWDVTQGLECIYIRNYD